jgi:lipopolysaccharide assembly outer membrane protein LptD (OstA)
MRRVRALLLAGAVLLVAAPRGVRAQDVAPTQPPPPAPPVAQEVIEAPEFTLLADEVVYDGERDLYEATGNVKITQADGRVLTTDWILFNGTTRTGVATGNVRVVDAQNTVRAQFLAIDLRSTVSVAMQGSLDNPQPGFTVRGDVIKRTGVDTYEIENGAFTTCRCPPESERRPWEIEVEDADVELGGYAVGKNLWFKAFDIPILYVPWLVFPVKTARQTGFLLPTFAQSSRNGTELSLPFFWAIGEQLNFTLDPLWISERGFKPTTEVEYVVGETGYGEGGAAILPGDRKVKNSDTSFFSDDRWSYRLRHEQPLAPGIGVGLDVNRVSDNDYVVDFRRDFGNDAEHWRLLESAAWATAARRGLYGGMVASVNDDLQNPTDLDRDGYFLQRLPDVRMGTLPRAIPKVPVRFGFESRATNFVQTSARRTIYGNEAVNGQFFDTGEDGRFSGQEPGENGQSGARDALGNPIDFDRDDFNNPNAVTTTEGDGLFQEGELLADDGQRVDLYPTVSVPVRAGIFELLGEGGVRETVYLADHGDNEERTLYTARADARTRFAKRFAVGTVPLQHVLEPKVAFAAVFAPDQADNPLFIPEPARVEPRLIDGDIRLITRNPSDRVPDDKLLQVQLANRLYGPPTEDAGPPRLYGELRVGSGYDFHEDALTRLFALAQIRPSRELSFSLDAGWNPEEHHLEDLATSAGWQSEAGHQLRVGYRYNRNPSPVFESFLGRGGIFDSANQPSDKVKQLDASIYVVATKNLELFAEGFKSLESQGSKGGRIGTVFISSCKCWDLVTELERDARADDTRFTLQFRLTGLGEHGPASDVDRRRFDRQYW